MADDFYTRNEQEQFARRVEAEDGRQNKRLENLEETVKKIGELTVSIEKMSISISQMAAEIKHQSARLECLEAKPGKRWDLLVSDVIKLLISALLGFLFAKIGLGI